MSYKPIPWFITAKNRFLLLSIAGCLFLTACNKDDEKDPEIPMLQKGLLENILTIEDIQNIPEQVDFDKVTAEITGVDWSIIASVNAPYEEGKITLTLLSAFNSAQLQAVDRGEDGSNRLGYWPSVSSDPQARVASLGDIIAYQNGVKVGRIYLSDWSGEGASTGKAHIYYQYADRPFTLTGFTGKNNAYYYSQCSLEKGWNAYANINPSANDVTGNVCVTTSFSDGRKLGWQFESWVH